jgi:DNA-binding CsgD family transcriptional regulator
MRVFTDEGAPLAAVLDQLTAGSHIGHKSAASGVPLAYLRRLQAALRPREARPDLARPVPAAEVTAPVLAEPLTDRELQVLALLAAGIPSQQIARELVVTLETVKTHVSHILGKLGGANRTEAVARARAVGLLEQQDRAFLVPPLRQPGGPAWRRARRRFPPHAPLRAMPSAGCCLYRPGQECMAREG